MTCDEALVNWLQFGDVPKLKPSLTPTNASSVASSKNPSWYHKYDDDDDDFAAIQKREREEVCL